MSLSLSLTHSLKQEQKLIMEQKLEHRLKQNHLMLHLVEVIREERFEPKAICPQCRKKLIPLEIIDGFENDPVSIRTKCPKCGTLFTPQLSQWTKTGNISLIFYCPLQVQEEFKDKYLLTTQELKKLNSSAYYSCILHFGSAKNMFKKMNINYRFKEKAKEEKIYSFLGKMPDSVIAKYSGISPSQIGRIRRGFEIPVYDKRGVK
jgi:hypothetical protein